MNMIERTYFEPNPDHAPAFLPEEWKAFWDSLSDAQKDSIRDKARWEHATLSAVAMQWGVSSDVS